MSAVTKSDLDRFGSVVAGMDDAELVRTMLFLLSPYGDSPMVGGYTDTSAAIARCTFFEVAARWIPIDAFAEGFQRHEAQAEPICVGQLVVLPGGKEADDG